MNSRAAPSCASIPLAALKAVAACSQFCCCPAVKFRKLWKRLVGIRPPNCSCANLALPRSWFQKVLSCSLMQGNSTASNHPAPSNLLSTFQINKSIQIPQKCELVYVIEFLNQNFNILYFAFFCFNVDSEEAQLEIKNISDSTIGFKIETSCFEKFYVPRSCRGGTEKAKIYIK